MQQGHIKRIGDTWFLYYWRTKLKDGKVVRCKAVKKLAPFGGKYRTEASVRPLADEILEPLNAQTTNESLLTVKTFLKHRYLPHVRETKRPSTAQSYEVMFDLVEPHLSEMEMRDVRTSTVDGWIRAVAESKPRAHTTLRNVKSFLSGAFRYAKRTDAIKDNPVRDSYVPKGLPARPMKAYTLPQVQEMLPVVPEPARTACLVAALTGLRVSELKGLRWEDVQGNLLYIRRGVVMGQVNDTKTLTSRAPVPLLPLVKQALENHRKVTPDGYIFQGRTGKPLRLENLVRRVVKPALEKAGLPWYGWHAFRHGVGTNLRDLGVDVLTVSNILRHGDTSVTEQFYINPVSPTAKAGMKKLEKAFTRASKKS
jgi:integrase